MQKPRYYNNLKKKTFKKKWKFKGWTKTSFSSGDFPCVRDRDEEEYKGGGRRRALNGGKYTLSVRERIYLYRVKGLNENVI